MSKTIITNTNQYFEHILTIVQTSDWKLTLSKAKQNYNIRLYNIEKLTINKIRQIYYSISQRFYEQAVFKSKWHENQLRIFIWLLLTYSNAISKSVENFDQVEWQHICNIFKGKTIDICIFQYLNLKKNSKRSMKWSSQEDEYLKEIIDSQYDQQKNNWNQIAKQLFIKTQKKFFRSAKQCRQRWNNSLDPHKKHGNWTIYQDLILISEVLQKGKKWSNIARALEQKRTQHMVKNRFKSLLLKEKKKQRKKEWRFQSQLLQNLIKKLKRKLSQYQNKQKIKKQNVYQQPKNNKILQGLIQQITIKNQTVYEFKNQILQNQQIQKLQVATPMTPSIFSYSPYNQFNGLANYQFYTGNYETNINNGQFPLGSYFLFQNFSKLT